MADEPSHGFLCALSAHHPAPVRTTDRRHGAGGRHRPGDHLRHRPGGQQRVFRPAAAGVAVLPGVQPRPVQPGLAENPEGPGPSLPAARRPGRQDLDRVAHQPCRRPASRPPVVFRPCRACAGGGGARAGRGHGRQPDGPGRFAQRPPGTAVHVEHDRSGPIRAGVRTGAAGTSGRGADAGMVQ
ncbi:hypothetical protein D9M72_568250 [compost metagenome]